MFDLFHQPPLEATPTVSKTEAIIWVDIQGYEGIYQISTSGIVKNIIRNSIKKTFLAKNGYFRIELSKDSVDFKYTLHRLIAEAFIPNPEGKLFINHINGIKTDNRIENLEWCTASENNIHAVATGLSNLDNFHQARRNNTANKPGSKIVLNTETGVFYHSMNEAAMSIGINHQSLSNMLTGKRPNKTSLRYA